MTTPTRPIRPPAAPCSTDPLTETPRLDPLDERADANARKRAANAAGDSRPVMRALTVLLPRMTTAILLQAEVAYLQNDRIDSLEAQIAALAARVAALEAARGVEMNTQIRQEE